MEGKRGLTIAQQNLPHATLALSEYSEIDTFWSMIPSAKLSSLRSARREDGCQLVSLVDARHGGGTRE